MKMEEMEEDRLLCCDWGTTNFRLYLMDTVSQEKVVEVSAGNGIGEMNDKIGELSATDRVDYYSSYLNHQIKRMTEEASTDLNQIPVLLSGMASSSIGMIEVPYATLPFSLSVPNLRFKKIREGTLCPHDLYVFGGIKSSNDVMRGEEVQILGLRQVIDTDDCICILPGTHSKHIRIEDSMIVGFDTYFSGELFQLLSQRSILQHSVTPSEVMTDKDRNFFVKGVREGVKSNLLKSLFKVRSNDILKQIGPDHNYFYLSGLLVGYELGVLKDENKYIYLGGGSSLTTYYELGLGVLGMGNRLTVISQEDMQMSIPKAHAILFNNLNNTF